jgi:transcriptional regulator with XRE-family HTH domain
MIEFGKTLRAAREAKGLSVGQVAEQTHMMVQTVEGLENEDFGKIVAPIYGRGFVKLYCEAVGLDPKPMIEAFMSIYADKHAASAKSQPPKPVTASAQTPAPEPVQNPSKPIAAEPPPKHSELDFGATNTAKAPLSRYAGTLPSDSEQQPSPLAMVNWRIVALAAGAFVVLLLLALGIRAVYHATMSTPESPAESAETQTTNSETPATSGEPQTTSGKPQTTGGEQQAVPSRKPLPLKPFYIDSDHSTDNERSK